MGCLNRANNFGRRVRMMETGRETAPSRDLPSGLLTNPHQLREVERFRDKSSTSRTPFLFNSVGVCRTSEYCKSE
jgi:hypothetical protein